MPRRKSEFGLITGIAGAGISSRAASPTSNLLQEEGIASWKSQPLDSRSSHEGPAAAHKMHSSPQGNYGFPTQLSAGINFGLESKPLKEGLELQPRTREASTNPPTCGAEAGSDSLRPENGLCANTVQLPLGMNGSGKGISKRRSCASRGVPTTVLQTSTKDFRDTVQRLTGLPVVTRFAKGRELLGAHVVRPQPKRVNLEVTEEVVSKSCRSYPSSPNGTKPQNSQFHANSHSIAVQQTSHAAVSVPPLMTSRAPQVSNLNFDKHQRKVGDIHTTSNYFSRSNNDGTNIMANLYEALARSVNGSTPVATAAAPLTTGSTPSMPVTTDSVAHPAARKFTMHISQMEELKSTSAGGSNVRTPKLDTDLLSGSYSTASAPSRLYRTSNLLSETKQGVDNFLSSSSSSSSSTRYQPTASNAELALAKLRGPNPAKDQDQQQQEELSFTQLDRWFQSDQVIAGMHVV